MRVLLYGMQSSGASLVTFFLGQARRSAALVDVWIRHLTPRLADEGADHVIAKCTVSTLFDFDEHARSFQPDRTVLVLRHPAQNYASLVGKDYVEEGGPIDEKFARLEEVFAERERFDLVLAYEDFVAHPEKTVASFRSVGIEADPRFYRFRRSTRRIKAFNFAHDPWCGEHYGYGWSFGNVQGTRLKPGKLYRPAPAEAEARVRRLCPSVCAYYDEHHAWLPEQAADGGAQHAGRATTGWKSLLTGIGARF